MARLVTYYEGGFNPSAAQGNRADLMDGATNLFTRWDRAGAQLEQRALTAGETAALAAQDAANLAGQNGDTLRTKAAQALTTNATFLAITTPSAAQNAAQAKALTRQVNGLIRLLLGALDDVSGT